MSLSGNPGNGSKPRGRFSPARIAVGLALLCLVVFASAFAWSLGTIYDRVESIRNLAGERYGGDKVFALLSLAGDEQAPFKLRNEACWALGQLGDARALPVLQKLDTDEDQAKPWNGDGAIVQYTVEKAIRQINSDFSLTRWMYSRLG